MVIDSYLSGFFLVLGSDVLAILGLLAVRKILKVDNLISTHDVGGYLLSVVGTMYAVILGLVVVDSMSKFDTARQTAERESNSLANIILLTKRFPAEKHQRIRAIASEYVDRVIHDEWPLLDRGSFSSEARLAALRLIDEVYDFEPATESEKTIYAAAVTTTCDFWQCRRTRTVTAEHGVPVLEWVVLIVGGVITVTFTYVFRLEHLAIQAVMTALVSTVIALCLYLVLIFGYPYSGDL
ncbi:bestrophin-like domain [Singulisphaera rosea]